MEKTKPNYTKAHQVKLLKTSYKKEILNSSKEKKKYPSEPAQKKGPCGNKFINSKQSQAKLSKDF